MKQIKEGDLVFEFSDEAYCAKYDDWSFYRNQFIKIATGVKAIDILLIENNTTWLIEVKDYRNHVRTKVIDLGVEIAEKVRDTLAGLAAARINASELEEKNIADMALKTPNIKIILHLEQPKNLTRLRPTLIDPSNVMLKLKQIVKSVDPHPRVLNKDTLRSNMNWKVTA